MTGTSRPILLLLSFLPAVVASTGCAVLTVDVDVFKGALNNHEAVQVQQVVSLATGAKPLLVHLRDLMESDGRTKAMDRLRERPWYRYGYVARPTLPPHKTNDDMSWRDIGEHPGSWSWFDPLDNDTPNWFIDSRAVMVNDVLGLYEDRGDQWLSWAIERMETYIQRQIVLYDALRPDNAVDKRFWEDLELAPADDQKSRLAYGAASVPETDRSITPPLRTQVQRAFEQLLYPQKDNPEAFRREIGRIREVMGTDSAVATFQRLRNPAEVEEYARVLFSEEVGGSAAKRDRIVERVTRFADAFMKIYEMNDEMLVLTLHMIQYLAQHDTGMTKSETRLAIETLGRTGASWIISASYFDYALASSLIIDNERIRVLNKFADPGRLSSSISDPSRIPGYLRDAAVSIAHRSAGVQPAGTRFNTASNQLLDLLSQQPYEVATELLLIHRILKTNADNPNFLWPADIQDGYLHDDDRFRFGLASGPILVAQNDDRRGNEISKDDLTDYLNHWPTLRRALGEAFAGSALARGRLDLGIESLTERYLGQAYRFQNSNAPEDNLAVGRARDQLLDELIRFAQKILFIANNETFFGADREGLFGDTYRAVKGFLADGYESRESFVDLMQAVGNSILNQVDEIRQQERYKTENLRRRDTELRAYERLFVQFPGDELGSALLRPFDRSIDDQIDAMKTILASRQSDLDTLKKNVEQYGIPVMVPTTTSLSVAFSADQSTTISISANATTRTRVTAPTPGNLPMILRLPNVLQTTTVTMTLLASASTTVTLSVTAKPPAQLVARFTATSPAKVTSPARIGAPASIVMPADASSPRTIALVVSPALVRRSPSLSKTDHLRALKKPAGLSDLHDELLTSYGLLLTIPVASAADFSASMTDAFDASIAEITKLLGNPKGPEFARKALNLRPPIKALIPHAKKIESTRSTRKFINDRNYDEQLQPQKHYGGAMPPYPDEYLARLIALLEQDLKAAINDEHKSALESALTAIRATSIDKQFSEDLPAGLKTMTDVRDALLSMLKYEHVQVVKAYGADSDAAGRLAEAIKAASFHKSSGVYIRPSSAYLRMSYPATSLQRDAPLDNENLLLAGVADLVRDSWEALPYTDISDARRRSRTLQQIDKQFWQNINRVRVSGAGDTNYVIAKDDVGNWYVKNYSADPKDIINSAQSLAMFSLSPGLGADLLSASNTAFQQQSVGNPIDIREQGFRSIRRDQLAAATAAYANATRTAFDLTSSTLANLKSTLGQSLSRNELTTPVQALIGQTPLTAPAAVCNAVLQPNSDIGKQIAGLIKTEKDSPKQLTLQHRLIIAESRSLQIAAMVREMLAYNDRILTAVHAANPPGNNSTIALQLFLTEQSLHQTIERKTSDIVHQRRQAIGAYTSALSTIGIPAPAAADN
jgi:hypothetical protein